jgi:hypothetical protein
MRRHNGLPGNLDTASRRRELKAVIHAAQIITLDTPLRQRREPVTAAIRERGDAAVRLAIEHDWFSEHGARHRALARKMMAPAGDIPAIVQKHLPSPPRVAG